MDFVGRRKVWFLISGILIISGIISILLTGMNVGIDFKGGTILHYDIGENFDNSQVRHILNQFDLKDNEVKKAGEDKQEVIIRTRVLSQSEKAEIFNAFKAKWPNTQSIRMEEVDPIIGGELRNAALVALVIAAIGMIIYITLRFEFKFAVTAIIAVLHDALVVLSFFALLKIPVNAPFVAAILTVIGYSINDTIVVYDRIRENLKLMHRASLENIVNSSIIQTLTRSINTSLTTLIVITILYILGGETIKDFALALIVGILAGTYSSIFIASPLWVMWKKTERGIL
ncbi:Protein translocase subunit SecDF [Koleobacter methoxysyntrophicus]|uniref:Protein-export membrane protein SecF n=1 Tax=Koleobacter methoxysyntrophicus TaxID=2751313 RepID=A0A8A0RNK8_9FIRM|nr:protein translocase subunit SecF [Koleobacter methoxysyntrophicus]MDI3540800.1 preprotein translocase subunit SecF [Thermosediminibacterales bacterium]QSQ09985.1 Protein translocase subunit SecDF [Koleobacter methoxysyntrophicus]